MNKHFKLKKVLICIAAVLGGVLVLVTVIYINIKNFTVKRMQSADGQEVYLMGTFHTNHFDTISNYSFEEMLNAIENIDPDVIFIEAREENYEQYGVVDGPVDMCITYCYCQDNDIPVEMIDYWKVDNDNYKRNTTTDDRDDHIHQKIIEKLKLYDNKKVLVICGFGHLYPQVNRLLAEGMVKEKLPHISSLFKSDDKEFKYPSSINEVWEQRAFFYAYTYPESIQEDETINDEVKAQWPIDENHSFYDSQIKYCDLFSANQLYR
ncbi:hypothetical protein SAMN05421493_12123 [Pseudobutyrivibrio sp. 49]|uniref:hypothetical protein n=1 Tax=Pseudobutyrivibrio sp. 49 TaxID=1855344 RepID=UPI000883862A|nr:hypothetical protein [Pseudobutyrivibrio sp. 49]SDI64430.1 hypothetical protein SAMN05421493_12123 [Pseudobutyrivibrio sp. 49]